MIDRKQLSAKAIRLIARRIISLIKFKREKIEKTMISVNLLLKVIRSNETN